MLHFLEDKDHCPLAQHDTVAVGIVGPRGFLRVESAFICANAPTASGVTTASAPPAIITSASPRWMARAASPSEWPLVAQAEATLMLDPRKSNSMATWPARMLGAVCKMKNGEIFR
jgi:hypothetical protein